MAHIPVLLKEVIQYLDPKKNKNFIDATIGDAGHSIEILKRTAPKGKLLGLDWDKESLKRAKKRLREEGIKKERAILHQSNFKDIKEITQQEKFFPVHGVLMDLGMSSYHIDESKRGFSYLRDEPLDMRFDKKSDLTAAEIINSWEIDEIEKILRFYGEERYSRRVVLGIKEARKKERIISTGQLVEILKRALPRNYDRGRIHPASRTFQALRIVVNDELESLKTGLSEAIRILEKNGRIAVISFHSLEDRIVKNLFRKYAAEGKIKILTKKPVVPSQEEIKTNPRSHSGKLRAAVKI